MVTASTFLAAAAALLAQFPQIPRLRLPGRADDLVWERLLQRDPPITTGLSDALTEVPYLDDYQPAVQVPMSKLGYGSDGVYKLFGGEFTITAESYCLRAGAHARASGNGYAYAELRGPGSEIIRHVMQHSVNARDISQPTIQMLVWAILSRTKLDTMSADLRRAAARLLDRKELSSLDGGAIGIIPDDVRARIEPRLPEPVRETLDAENRLRGLAARAGATFDQWQQLAVLPGNAEPHAGDRVIPSGRWSFHQAGFFVRFDPASFLQTRIDVSVPAAIKVTRDARGRIASVADRVRQLRIAYDEQSDQTVGGATRTVGGAASVRAARFSSVEYRDADAELRAGDPVLSWKARGWTLVGAPAGGAASGQAAFPGLTQRYEHAVVRTRDIERVLSSLKRAPAAPGDGAAVAADVANLREALAALQQEAPVKTTWRANVDGFLVQAWEASFAMGAGVAGVGADPPFDPSGVVAVPGSVTAQRLGMSPRPAGGGPQPHCRGQDSADGFEGAVARGMGVGLDQVSVTQDGGLEKIFSRTRGGCALPDSECLSEAIGQGTVPAGSLQAADYIIVGAIQQAGGTTRVTLRAVNVETGEIVAVGMADAAGTGPAAVQQATSAAMKSLTSTFPLGGVGCH